MKKEVESHYNIGDRFYSVEGFWKITKINWSPTYDLKLINNDGVGKRCRCPFFNRKCWGCLLIIKVGTLENRSQSSLDDAVDDRIFQKVDKKSIVDEGIDDEELQKVSP